MNRGFYGTLLAVLVTIAALSCIASAKDYSVTAGNWQVDFRTNDTLYTETELFAPKGSAIQGYVIWVKMNPKTKEKSGAIHLRESNVLAPFDKDSLRPLIRSYLSSMNKTPIVSDYFIDDTDAVIAEGWYEEHDQMDMMM